MERLDIRITRNGDLDLTPNGDIQKTSSMQQAILIHLRWIFAEWRLGPEYGFPYFEDVFIKDPDLERIKRDIRAEITKVKGVRYATVDRVEYDPAKREAKFTYTAVTDLERFTEEVTLYA